MRRLPPTSRGVPARCRRGSLRDQQQHQSFTSGTLPRLSSHYVVRSYDGGNSWTRPQLVTTLNDNCFVIATPDEEAAMAQLVRRSMSSTTFRAADREAQALGERPRVRPRSRCGHDLRSPALQEVDERHQDLHLHPHTCGGWDNTGRAATRRQPPRVRCCGRRAYRRERDGNERQEPDGCARLGATSPSGRDWRMFLHAGFKGH